MWEVEDGLRKNGGRSGKTYIFICKAVCIGNGVERVLYLCQAEPTALIGH